jgi:hypothetical protein
MVRALGVVEDQPVGQFAVKERKVGKEQLLVEGLLDCSGAPAHALPYSSRRFHKSRFFLAADELQAAGQRPTLKAIRQQKVGGSYTTLAPLLREWKAVQSRVDDAPLPGEPVPESIAARMAESGREVWRAALDLANSRLQAEREALEKARTEIERERDEAVALADRMAEERDSARAEVQRLTIEVAVLRADLAAASDRATASAVEIARLQEGALEAVEPLLAELKARAAAHVA